MNENLQKLEVKIENQGTTPQGKVSAAEWNILVAAVKALDAAGIDTETLAKYLKRYQYITTPELEELLKDVTENLDGVVDLKSAQTIEGLKDFINGFKIGGALVKYDTAKKCFVFTENVLIEKGLAWNSRFGDFTEEEIFSITKAVDVDWETIGKRADGKLYVIPNGSAGGGEGGGGNYDPDFLHNYLTNNKYITESALTSYAKTADVNSLLTEYLPKSGGEIKSGNLEVLSLKTLSDAGYAAIGFYSGDARIGVLRLTGDMNASIYDGNFNNAVNLIHSGNYYNYALPITGGTVNGDISIPVAHATMDNSIPVSGGLDRYGKNYYDAIPGLKTFIGTIESSDFGWQHTISVRHRNGYSDGATEGLVFRHSLVNVNDSIHWSHQRRGVWSDERVLLDSSNYSNYALPITGGTINGSIYFGETETRGENTSGLFRIGKFDENGGLKLQFGADSNAHFAIVNRRWDWGLFEIDSSGNVVAVGNMTALKFIGALQGNADSATLWSYNSPWVQDFDALNYSNNGLYHFDGDYANLAGKPPHYAWHYTILNMGFGPGRRQQVAIPYDTSKMFLRVNVDDNWSGWREFAFVDTDSLTPSSGILTVNGNLLATGRIAWNSSRVLKTEVKEHYLSLAKLEQIKPYSYKWKDGRDDLVHVGAVADEVMGILPETVLTDSLGIHSMDYAQTAFVMAASLTPHVSDHERRIKELETENAALKREIEKLKRVA